MSPGLRSRPSLSAYDRQIAPGRSAAGVAGTTVPAFVERLGEIVHACVGFERSSSVAGTTVPAFVERTTDTRPDDGAHVSPGYGPGLR